MNIAESSGKADPSAERRPAWETPTIDDYGIVGTTRLRDDEPGIDLFEESNPNGYGS